MNILLIPELVRWIRKLFRALGILPASSTKQSMRSGLVLSSTMKNFIRCAGISGTLAICLGVYGGHAMKDNNSEELKRLYQLAQTYHLLHSVALIAVPLVPRPMITGCLFVGGTILFCGPMYYRAIRNDPRFRPVTPYGGFLLLAGWLSIAVL